MKAMGLHEDSREVGLSIANDDDEGGSESEPDRSAAKQYRGVVARMKYLGKDRSMKELSGSMANPTEKDNEG